MNCLMRKMALFNSNPQTQVKWPINKDSGKEIPASGGSLQYIHFFSYLFNSKDPFQLKKNSMGLHILKLLYLLHEKVYRAIEKHLFGSRIILI